MRKDVEAGCSRAAAGGSGLLARVVRERAGSVRIQLDLDTLSGLVLRRGMIPWLGLGMWLLVLVPVFVSATADDQSLVDFLVGVTLWRVEPSRLGWARTCALAFVLLYLGRPVGWGLIYLELLILAVLWPELRGWRRGAVLVGAIALMGSHWWALGLTLQGRGLQLLTLQSPQWPWETVLVLPLAWWLLVAHPMAPGRRDPHERDIASAGACLPHTM